MSARLKSSLEFERGNLSAKRFSLGMKFLGPPFLVLYLVLSARIGLILTIQNPEARDRIDAGEWKLASRRYRRLLGMALERKTLM